VYEIIILLVVLYGCETWSVLRREEHSLKEYENRMLRRREEVVGEWRRLHNDELRNLYASLSIIRLMKSRKIRWADHIARVGEVRNT